MMKTILWSLFVFSIVITFTWTLPVEKEDDEDQSLIGSKGVVENEVQPVNRRRPPIKIPGPKLTDGNKTNSAFSQNYEPVLLGSDNQDSEENKTAQVAPSQQDREWNKDYVVPLEKDEKGKDKCSEDRLIIPDQIITEVPEGERIKEERSNTEKNDKF